MKSENLPHHRRRRAQLATGFLVLLMALLVASFFRAQVLRSTTWTLQADSNRLRVLPVPAPRGTIFDREGRIIADNVPSYSVSLFPAPLDSIRGTLERLQPHLGLSDGRVETLVETAARNPRLPLLVEPDAGYDEVAALEERRMEFPGVFMEMRPRRRYNSGPAVAHALGYVGEISSQELEMPRFSGYEQGMIVGKEGVERQYEEILQGHRGVRYVEVDAVGRIVGSFEGQLDTPAESGEDLHLNLDLELMEWIHEIFPDTLRGAVVALDAADGGVLALYSAPSFDPNDFVGGIEPALWTDLNADPNRPLFNRATVGRYPPASTWKLATAAIGLEMGVVDPEEPMPVACHGGFRYGNVYRRCWNPDGHGHLNLMEAIQHSCNVYFYQLGLRISLEGLVEEGARLGFHEECGVDLPRESPGVFPAGLDYWETRFGYRPYENEVLSLAIGQGPNDQTPLKMAHFYLGLARDGTAPLPTLVQDPAPPEGWSLDLAEESLEALRDGLGRVVAPGGTAFLSSLEHWDLMGKTGTGQQNPGRPPHAWFVGMAGPREGDPEIVVSVIVEEGQSGSAAAAPIASKAADFFLRNRYGIPVDTIQTLGEHIRAGQPAPWAQW